MPTYPPVTIPADQSKKGKSTRAVFNRYVNAHPALKPYAQQLWNSANEWGLDPVYFANLVWFESRGNPNAVSSANAIGLGQVTAGKVPPWLGRAVTADDLKNPGLNLRVAAWYFSQGLQKYGTYQAAYLRYYNPGYKGPSPFAGIPKGYVVSGGKSPADKANAAASQQAANAQQPQLARQQARQVLDPIYQSYTGRAATDAQVNQWLAHPVSIYALSNYLSDPNQNPKFYRSPIWQTGYHTYETDWKQIFGPDSKPDRNAIRYAIVHNLSSPGFQQRLRDRQDYNTSEEYQGLHAQYSAQFSSIYGTPDPTAHAKIDMAIRKGWNGDQWKAFLRAQPEWQGSGEYQKLALGLSDALGFEPGLGSHQTVMNQGGPAA